MGRLPYSKADGPATTLAAFGQNSPAQAGRAGNGRGAQAKVDPVAPPTGNFAEEGNLPQALDRVEPFSHWQHHIGTGPETVASIYVLSPTGAVERRGCGFVARCDGFVLVPASLFADNVPTNDRIVIGFSSADGEELKEALPATGPPRVHSTRAAFVLLKVNDHHLPCLPMLDARNVVKGNTVKLYQAPLETAPVPAKAAVSFDGSIESVLDSTTFTVRVTGNVTPENQPKPGTVITTESGKESLGIVLGTAAAGGNGVLLQCSSYANLNWVSNDIGLRMKPDESTETPPDEMVRVPGGPIRLAGPVAKIYHEWYGIDYACCPEFEIDKDPVTVADYRAWLAPRRAPRQPENWVESDELHTHRRQGDLPVTSLWVQDAMLYAGDHEKRLITPIEWERATLNPNLGWYEEYLSDFRNVQTRLDDIDNSKFLEYKNFINSPAVNRRQIISGPSSDRYWCNTQTMQELNRQERLVISGWFLKYSFPFQLTSVGKYPKDKNGFGVHNVLMNMPEMLLPNFGRSAANELAWKPYAATVEPYFSYVRQVCLFADITPDQIDGVFLMFFLPNGTAPRIKTEAGKGSIQDSYAYETNSRATFRCAR